MSDKEFSDNPHLVTRLTNTEFLADRLRERERVQGPGQSHTPWLCTNRWPPLRSHSTPVSTQTEINIQFPPRHTITAGKRYKTQRQFLTCWLWIPVLAANREHFLISPFCGGSWVEWWSLGNSSLPPHMLLPSPCECLRLSLFETKQWRSGFRLTPNPFPPACVIPSLTSELMKFRNQDQKYGYSEDLLFPFSQLPSIT